VFFELLYVGVFCYDGRMLYNDDDSFLLECLFIWR